MCPISRTWLDEKRRLEKKYLDFLIIPADRDDNDMNYRWNKKDQSLDM